MPRGDKSGNTNVQRRRTEHAHRNTPRQGLHAASACAAATAYHPAGGGKQFGSELPFLH